MNRRRGLGSGLEALIPGNSDTTRAVREILIDEIRENRSQPRTQFDEQALDELAVSIREHGLLQPLIVIEHAEGGYELIAGERRWRAARRAGLTHVPVLLKEATPQQLLELALVENVQRADLNPLEEGRAYQTLKDEFGLTDDEIARRVGKSRVTIANARRLIRLIPDVQQKLLEGTITAGHGRALLRLEQPEQQAAALALLLRRDMSVREIELLTELLVQSAMTPEIQQALLMGAISSSHAQALLRFTDAAMRADVLDVVLARSLGARDVERLYELVAEGATLDLALERAFGYTPHSTPIPAPTPPASSRLGSVRENVKEGGTKGQRVVSPEDNAVERMFEEALGTPVQLIRSSSAIKVMITIYTDEQLQGLYDLIAGTTKHS